MSGMDVGSVGDLRFGDIVRSKGGAIRFVLMREPGACRPRGRPLARGRVGGGAAGLFRDRGAGARHWPVNTTTNIITTVDVAPNTTRTWFHCAFPVTA